MLTTFKATANKLKEGLQVETSIRSFKILMDEPAELGGTDMGPNPVEVLLAALGACQSIVAFAFAESHNIKIDGFYVKLEGDLDPDGFLGLSNARKGFQEIRYEIHFITKEPLSKIQQYVEFIERTCPVGDCLQNGVRLVKSNVIID